MKLEKREITLNEFDSLRDAFYIEQTLMREIEKSLFCVWRKEARDKLIALLQETAENALFLQDLMSGTLIENK
jgi:hypothetical protein